MRLRELLAYELVLVGAICDQLTTRYLLKHPFISESNPFAAWFMEHGLWLPLDVAIIVALIMVPFILLRRWSFRGRDVLLLGPATFGTLRLSAAVLNVNLYWNLIT